MAQANKALHGFMLFVEPRSSTDHSVARGVGL